MFPQIACKKKSGKMQNTFCGEKKRVRLSQNRLSVPMIDGVRGDFHMVVEVPEVGVGMREGVRERRK